MSSIGNSNKVRYLSNYHTLVSTDRRGGYSMSLKSHCVLRYDPYPLISVIFNGILNAKVALLEFYGLSLLKPNIITSYSKAFHF